MISETSEPVVAKALACGNSLHNQTIVAEMISGHRNFSTTLEKAVRKLKGFCFMTDVYDANNTDLFEVKVSFREDVDPARTFTYRLQTISPSPAQRWF